MRRDGGYIREVLLGAGERPDEYPFALPVVEQLARAGGLALAPGVTFLVGENGSGKSTLVEAMAVAAGMNPEGGSQHYRFATRASESSLGAHLVLKWGINKPRSRFFLRAESYYNVATETEALGPEQLAVFGGVSPHERSHGESFVDLMRVRFFPGGLYLLDEPEAALSVRGCMAVLARLAELVEQRCQIVVATHSPILLALPGATIYEITEDGAIVAVDYDDALPVRLTRDFLAEPDRYLRHLFDDE
ncbi:AAA family ATPase [Nocardia sp. NPDC049149]|uniref:AAA family ATPase n=1 Tax=Nocardia sp. NPDC049149 TaxID=3364315 RepID=UPI00371F09AA